MPPISVVEDLACILLRCSSKSLRLHAHVYKSGRNAHTLLGNHIVQMLVKGGYTSDAQKVFDLLPNPNELSWNALVTGYGKEGEPIRALHIYTKLHKHEALHLDGYSFLALLKACIELEDWEMGCKLHKQITENGLINTDVFLGSTLIDFYVKCGSITRAGDLFDNLQVRDVITWTTLMAGYVEHGHVEDALDCIRQMQQEGVSPDAHTFTCSLKACGVLGSIERTQQVYTELTKLGLEKDLVVGSTLVDVYSKNGSVLEAKHVFKDLANWNTVSWNTLMTGFTECGHSDETLDSLQQMQKEGILPDAVTFASCLKACGSLWAVSDGYKLHTEILLEGFEREPIVGNTLVDMYVKCGMLASAQNVFEALPLQSCVTYNSLLGGCVEERQEEEAFACYEQMQLKGILPDYITCSCMLKACGNVGANHKVQDIHSTLTQQGLETSSVLINTLIDAYMRCDMIVEAREVFDKTSTRETVSWNILISGYAEQACGDEAVKCWESMAFPDVVTCSCSLKACGSVGAAVQGQKIHLEALKRGWDVDLHVVNTLVDFYAKLGHFAEAEEMFQKLQVRTVVPYNALLSGYVEYGHHKKVLDCFAEMQYGSIAPDCATFICYLKASSNLQVADMGRDIHSEVIKKGLDQNALMGSTLVEMYSRCKCFLEAQKVLNQLPLQTVYSWTALVSAYSDFGYAKDVFNCLKQMQHESVAFDDVVFACGLKACGDIEHSEKGMELHTNVIRSGLEEGSVVGGALVFMYGKCGLLKEAQDVFDRLRIQNLISWTALISGYVEHGRDQEALDWFGQLQEWNLSPDVIMLACGIKACASVGNMEEGHGVFINIVRKGLENDVVLSNTVVDMYAKCGLLAEAQVMFDELLVRDEASWASLMAAYGQLCGTRKVLILFDRLLEDGIYPDVVTFLSVLNECTHSGLMDRGVMYFEAMSKHYGISPLPKHYNCMVDLFARAGDLEKAFQIVERTPLQPCTVVWQTLMGACRKCKNLELGHHAFQQVMELDEGESAAYVCVSNIYAEADTEVDVYAIA